jgi:hypothetical protein
LEDGDSFDDPRWQEARNDGRRAAGEEEELRAYLAPR